MKSAIKLSLIDDYISIVLIENFCRNFHELEEYEFVKSLKSSTEALKVVVDEILDLLHLKNDSFLILTEQLSENNNLYKQQKLENFQNLKDFCNRNLCLLNGINLNLKDKLLKLKIKPTHLSHILQT